MCCVEARAEDDERLDVEYLGRNFEGGSRREASRLQPSTILPVLLNPPSFIAMSTCHLVPSAVLSGASSALQSIHGRTYELLLRHVLNRAIIIARLCLLTAFSRSSWKSPHTNSTRVRVNHHLHLRSRPQTLRPTSVTLDLETVTWQPGEQ